MVSSPKSATPIDEYALQLLLIDPDPIFRLGLRTVCQQFPDLQVVAEADTGAAASQILSMGAEATRDRTAETQRTPRVDLVILDLVLDIPHAPNSTVAPYSNVPLKLCQQLKARYRDLPVLLLTAIQEPALLRQAQALGVDGYCPKSIAVSELIAVIRQVADGETSWAPIDEAGSTVLGFLGLVANSWRLSGLRQIEPKKAQLMRQLQNPALSPLSRALLVGRLRELQSASWLLNQLLWTAKNQSLPSVDRREPDRSTIAPTPASDAVRSLTPISNALEGGSLRTLQATLFRSTSAKLGFSLKNLTGVPLEIDIFREEKRRSLLYIILRKLEEGLNDLRFAQVPASQLEEKKLVILLDLWSEATREFFGKYYRVQIGDRELELVAVLLQDASVVRDTILKKIPLVVEVFSHLLYQTALRIDNVPYSAGTPEAIERSEVVMENLIIQVANGVVQPLLNYCADVVEIKQSFYDQELISSRNIERFRNNLSWKYRYGELFAEPKSIFESQYIMFGFDSQGIKKISLYAPRRQELEKLRGWQQGVTLALEIRDAIAPRLRGVIAFVGSTLVYILTQVIGRGIGLVGRGILQGIGNSWSENKFGKNGDRQK